MTPTEIVFGSLLALVVLIVLAGYFGLRRRHAAQQLGWRRQPGLQVRIRKGNNRCGIYFIRDNGQRTLQTVVDLRRPYELILPYSRFMFLSYVFRPKQERVVIVGLGGGAMVHFLQHYDSDVKVDVIEVLPVMVKLADKHCGVRTGGNVNIITADGFEYFRETDAKYDVIYMDAFLKPTRDTDNTGLPLGLTSSHFYQELQKKLTLEGLVVFNLNERTHVAAIRDAFPQIYVFALPDGDPGAVVIGTMSERRMPRAEILSGAGELNRRFATSFSFQDLVQALED